jgi:hypothetical protein
MATPAVLLVLLLALSTIRPPAPGPPSSMAGAAAAVPALPTPLGGSGAPAAAAAERPLPFLYDLYTFRGDRGTLVVAAYAVEAGELEREHVGGAVRYRSDVSLVLNDTLRRSVLSRHDSVYVDLTRPLPAGHLLFTTVQLETPPSASTVQRVYMYNATAPGIGQFYMSPFEVPDYSGDDLMISDIVLGQPGAAGGWRRNDVAVAILPGRQFSGSAFDVYYEIYNLPERRAYTTEIAVERVETSESLVRLRFEGRASHTREAMVQEMRRVESSLPRGVYRMTVTITESDTGRSASRSHTFEVHSGRGAATMVPALPVAGGGVH